MRDSRCRMQDGTAAVLCRLVPLNAGCLNAKSGLRNKEPKRSASSVWSGFVRFVPDKDQAREV
jgi:hypothetical protein